MECRPIETQASIQIITSVHLTVDHSGAGRMGNGEDVIEVEMTRTKMQAMMNSNGIFKLIPIAELWKNRHVYFKYIYQIRYGSEEAEEIIESLQKRRGETNSSQPQVCNSYLKPSVSRAGSDRYKK